MVPRRLGEEMGTCERTWRSRRDQGIHYLVYTGQDFLLSFSPNPKGWHTRASDSRWGETHDTDLDVRAQRVPTATTYLAEFQPMWRKACGKGLAE